MCDRRRAIVWHETCCPEFRGRSCPFPAFGWHVLPLNSYETAESFQRQPSLGVSTIALARRRPVVFAIVLCAGWMSWNATNVLEGRCYIGGPMFLSARARTLSVGTLRRDSWIAELRKQSRRRSSGALGPLLQPTVPDATRTVAGWLTLLVRRQPTRRQPTIGSASRCGACSGA
jgi:hypothetical protein